MSRKRLRRMVGALVPALALTGCTAGGSAVPDSWAEASVPRLELRVPDGWEDSGALDASWAHHWVDTEDGEAVRQLAVATEAVEGTPSADTLGSGLLESLRMTQGEKFELLEKLPDPPELDGDYFRFRYTIESDQGDGPVQGVIWALGAPDAKPVAVRLTGWGIDDELVEQIDEGLRFRADS